MIPVLTLLFIAVTIGSLRYHGKKTMLHRHYTAKCRPPAIEKGDISFTGHEAGISETEIHLILIKRFTYYLHLSEKLQRRFIKRLRSFMHKKQFIIKDDEGFKDMPVLVSAAAVQLTFGLKKYKLPFYKYIRIYPEEYFAEHEFLKVLAGNVKNNVISVAWNQLLKSYENATDGSNIGLHEMAHAIYIQKMVIEENYANVFSRQYNHLITECRQAHKMETEGKKNLYSEYADNNLQEFWAESAELFFEKPEILASDHPKVFECMKLLLNQDPSNQQNPLPKQSFFS